MKREECIRCRKEIKLGRCGCGQAPSRKEQKKISFIGKGPGPREGLLKELETVIECNDRHCGVTDKYTVVIKGTVVCRNHKALSQFRTDSRDLFDMPFPGANKATYIILKELRRKVLG